MRSTISVLVTIMSLSLVQTVFGQAARNLSFSDWQSYNSAWHMDYVDKLVDERLDPIVNPNGASGHLHAIIGGSRFGASYNGAEYKKAQCTTCPISADKSNYWMPKMFWINNGGTSFTPIAGQQRFYYFLQQSSPNEPVSPFPDGLRMLTGSPDSKTSDSFRFSFICQVNPPPYQGSIKSDNFNFERDCPYGMKVVTQFPQCWDGINLYKADGSHMSYPVGTSYRVGNCPWTHPVRIPQVMTEFTYFTSTWASKVPLKGNLAWSNGDTTGFGVHADFVAGWDGDVLARALNDTRCLTGGEMAIEQCPVFNPYYDFAGSRASACKPEKGVSLESPQINDNVPIPRLPGCSPLWDGTGSKPACPAGDFTPDISGQQGSDGSYIANPTRNKVLPTTPGWKDIGCIRESTTMLKGSTSFYDQTISQTSCSNTCLKNGYSYAAVGLTQGKWWRCFCGTGVEDQAMLWPNMCNSPCPGNSTQTCGGDFSGYTVMYAPKGTTLGSNDTSYLGCYANPSTASTGLEGKATYTFSTSTKMTRESCFQTCADRGLGWAAIRNGQDCFCGADKDFDLGAGKYVSDALCSTKCSGNQTQLCGYYTGSSVFNVTALGYAKQDLGMPAGYQGCYKLPTGKAVKDYTYWDNALVPERCTLGCLELGYQYAEIDTGRICNCGNDLTLGASLPPSFCGTACFGAANQTCGGSYVGDLYTTNSSQPRLDVLTGSKHAGWSGCYDNSYAGGFKDWSRSNAASQTVEKCQISCQELGYKWAGLQNGDTCKCSNVAPDTQIKRIPTSRYCGAPCKGNSSETCGGSGGMIEAFDLSKYTKEVVNTNGPGYIGCYQQSGGPGLKAGVYHDNKMTVDMCAGMCRETGNSMAGLSNNQCTCGNTWEGGNVLASLSCNTPCPGNANQTCGASFIASVFNTTIGAPVTMPVAGYEGCYTDSNNRTLGGYSYTSRDGMSPTACKATCAGRGFAYAGVQNGWECYCDNQLGGVGIQVPSVQCSVACTGNSAQRCGASWRLSVYKTGSTGNSTTPVATPGKSIGCYQDFGTLDGANYYSDYMSANLCLPWCKAKGFALGGMSGRQCRCGNTSPSIVAARAACSLPCTGNSTQTCGSSSGNADVWSASTVFAANPYTTPDNKGYMGCWTDGAARLLTGSVFYSNALTPATCATSCAANKYTFAGVQNGNECRCGNVIDPKTTYYRTSESQCPKACTGDASAKCGGGYRYNIYATKEFLAGAGTGGNSTTPAIKAEGLLGCYGRGTFASTTAVQTTSSNGMTTGYCRRYCRIKGFSTAGLMGGNTCYCGSQNTLATVVSDSGCTTPCTGNSTSSCGGGITLSVYDTKGAGALTVPGYPSDYIGCYGDGTPRTLSGYSIKTSGASPDQCKAVCDAKGFPVYGLQNGNECYCGSLSRTDIVTDDQCSTSCAGNANQKCGGWYRLSVFGKLTANTTTTSAAPSASSSAAASSSSSKAAVSSSSSKAATSSASSSRASSASSAAASSSAAATTSRAASSSSAASVSRSASGSATTVSPSTTSESASNDPTDTSIPSTTVTSSSTSKSVSVTSASSSISSSSESVSASSSVVSTPVSSSASSSFASSASSSAAESTSAPASSSSTEAPTSSTSSTSSSHSDSSHSSFSASAASSAAASSSAALSSSAAATSSAAASSSSAAATTTSSSAQAPAPTDASLIGCFSSTTAFANANMTCDATSPRMCKIWCNAMNFKYAGVHNGDFCGCSNDVGSLNQVEISQCNVPCVADGTKMCGGQSTFEVFEAAPFGKARRDLSYTARGRAKWVRKSEE